MPKKTLPITIDVPTATPRRKRPAPKNAFAKGNPYRFQKGVSGNPAGRPKDEARNTALVSKALQGQLGVTAPHQIAEKLGLEPGAASWAQCLGASLIRRAVYGDMAAARLVLDFTENIRDALSITDTTALAPTHLEVFLVSPSGKPEPVIIDATPPASAE
jgi:hypothetical protein